MGYTHYYTMEKSPTTKEWSEFTRDISKILEISDIKIAGPMGKGKPIVNTRRIAFNGYDGGGYGDGSYESFIFKKNQDGFECCKTGERLYDVVVVASLIAAKKAFKDKIDIESDAHGIGDLYAGIGLFEKAINDLKSINDFLNDVGYIHPFLFKENFLSNVPNAKNVRLDIMEDDNFVEIYPDGLKSFTDKCFINYVVQEGFHLYDWESGITTEFESDQQAFDFINGMLEVKEKLEFNRVTYPGILNVRSKTIDKNLTSDDMYVSLIFPELEFRVFNDENLLFESKKLKKIFEFLEN